MRNVAWGVIRKAYFLLAEWQLHDHHHPAYSPSLFKGMLPLMELQGRDSLNAKTW
jgi:hypothetical protein